LVKGRGTLALVVPRERQGARLDQFVAGALREREEAPSRAEVQRWISHGRVTVDGAVAKAADKLAEGARVLVDPEPPPFTDAAADATVDFGILYVDDAIVVVNKPAGLVVHPARGHDKGTLVNGLLARGLFREEDLAGAAPEEEAHVRPGIVHRLDKGTSGILVVARTARAREGLKAQLSAHTVLREYEALVAGAVKTLHHDTLHGRHKTDRVRFTTHVRIGKRAVTHVRVVERFGALATHVVCSLETGRTHQIRVHLAESGTPILGDPLYGHPPKHPTLRAVADTLGHQALHARLLGFVHPTTGAAMRFEAPLPEDMAKALEGVRAIATPGPGAP
jgi:23S rRNA pseudouridine1911/1915/1917 synthase